MAQSQIEADVHQDELCPPNKCYALMDAKKKIDLDNLLCPNERKILENILPNHPLRFIIAASSSVPWIYLEAILAYFKGRWIKVYALISKCINVKENLVAREIDNMVEGMESKDSDEVDNSILNSQNDLNTRLDPESYMESPKVEKTIDVQHVNVIEEEEESTEDDYELRRRVKRKDAEETMNTPPPTPIRSLRIHSTFISSDIKKFQELTVTNPTPSSSLPSSSSSKLSSTKRLLSLFKPKTGRFKRYKSFFDELQGRYSYLFRHLKTRFLSRKKFNVLAQQLQEVMEESLPNMVDSSVRNYMSGHILHVHPTKASQASTQEYKYQLYLIMKDNPQLQHDDLPIWLALKIKFEGLHAFNTPCRSSAIRPRDQDDPHDDAHPEGENSAKRHKTSEHGTYDFGESSYC
nr:hypothetical protein [Tanacetum cinerariifolium]